MSTSVTRLLAARMAPVVLAVLVLAGCGDHGSSGSGRPPTTSTPTPTRTSTHATSSGAAGIPDDFPLAQGLVADGETTVSTARHHGKGIALEPRCWGHAWPGAAVDRLVVHQAGPELGVTRELAVYRDAASAAAVFERVRVDAAHCHRLPATSEQDAMEVTPEGDTEGAHSATSFAETLAGGQPGGSVFAFHRVGRAVLAVEDSSEWTRDSAVHGVRHLEHADRDLVSRLCVFRRAGC